MSISTLLPGWELVIFIALFVIFFVGAIITVFILLRRRYWNYNVLVMENQTGFGARPKYRDKARLVGIGDNGDEVFWLKKTKKFKIGYGKYIGQNYICWTIGKDGYWYNTVFGDVDKVLLEIGVFPVNQGQRYATSAVRDLVKNNYQSKGFMEKYGPIVWFGIFFITMLMFVGFMWFSFSQLNKISAVNAESSKTSLQVITKVGQILSSLDNVCHGGSGISAVTPPQA